MFPSAVALASLLVVSRVAAQTSTVSCSSLPWIVNDDGQTPCTLWAQVLSICTPDTKVNAIPSGQSTYPTPSGATVNDCNCNTITYNLMAGCSACQTGATWVSEAQWKTNCHNYSDIFPDSIIEQTIDINVPLWAFAPEDGSTFSLTEAEEASGVTPPEASGVTPSETSGGNNPFPSGPRAGGPDGDDGDDGDDVGDSVAAGFAIAIGVGLGVPFGSLFIIYIVVLVVFCTRETRRKAWYGQFANYGAQGAVGANPFMTPTSPQYAQQQMPYGQQPQPGMIYAPGTPPPPSKTPVSAGLSSTPPPTSQSPASSAGYGSQFQQQQQQYGMQYQQPQAQYGLQPQQGQQYGLVPQQPYHTGTPPPQGAPAPTWGTHNA